MQLSKLLDSVQYVTDTQGNKKAVLLDLDVWQGLVELAGQGSTLQHGDTAEGRQVSGGKQEAALAREEAAFRRLYPSIKKEYRGRYVAIYHEQVVDSDSDQVALYRRMRKQHPGEFVWIAPVGDNPDEVIRFRSPRLSNNRS